jgi:hypothetical protein
MKSSGAQNKVVHRCREVQIFMEARSAICGISKINIHRTASLRGQFAKLLPRVERLASEAYINKTRI